MNNINMLVVEREKSRWCEPSDDAPAGSAARVCEREDDDLVADDLIRQCERESIEHCDAPILSMLRLRSRLRNRRIIVSTASISSSNSAAAVFPPGTYWLKRFASVPILEA